MQWNRSVAMAGIITGVALAIGGIAAPAQAAQVWDPYCQEHVYDGAPFDTYLSRTAQCRVQGGPAASPANEFTYTGPVDGYMGTNSWKGLQAALRNYGYSGPIDGVPGTNTYKAIQRWAYDGGYTGPIDGVMGSNSWAGFNRAIRMQYFGL